MRSGRSFAVTVAVAMVVAIGPPAAQADLWDTLVTGSVTATQIDVTRGAQTGLTWRGGPQLSLPSGGGGAVVRVEAGVGAGCGITDFVGEFKAMFSTQALESYFEGLIGTAIASAPLVLLCYASPTLCDAYKHFKQMASEVLSLRAGECRAVEEAAASLGTSLNRQQQLACIDERIAAGDPSWVALDACKADQISIETAQPKLDCAVLKELPSKSVILGVLDLGDMNVETVETVATRVRRPLPYISADRIILAPDCGMKYLPREVAFGKLKAMADAAAMLRRELAG